MLIDWNHELLSVTKQAELLGISRSGLYYEPVIDAYDEKLMQLIDELYTKIPFYGSRKMAEALQRMGHAVGRKRIQRLMRTMGIEAIYPRPDLSKPHPEHIVYPYLLRNAVIERPDAVWQTSRMSASSKDLRISLPSWTGTHGTSFPLSSQRAWMSTSA
jgi:putative transposase